MTDVLIRTVEKQAVTDASGRVIAPAQAPVPERPAGPWDNNRKPVRE